MHLNCTNEDVFVKQQHVSNDRENVLFKNHIDRPLDLTISRLVKGSKLRKWVLKYE